MNDNIDDLIVTSANKLTNEAKNLKDDIKMIEDNLEKIAKEVFDALEGNANNVLENVIQNVKYENLDPNKVQNTKTLNMYLKNKKIDEKDFLVALQNSSWPLKKKLRLYMLLVSKKDRKFLDMYRLMSSDNFHIETYHLDNAIYSGESEVRNFTHYDEYIEFFKGLPEQEKTLKNLLLMPSFIIFWNINLNLRYNRFNVERQEYLTYDMCCEYSASQYNKKIDDLFDQIKFNNDIQNNKEKYKQTIKNMHLIYVKSMNSSYEDNPGRCLATELKDKDGNLIDVSQTFSDFADMLCEEKLIDENTRNRLKSGPNFLLLRLSVIWKYIKFFFRKNILRQKNIHYGYDSEILIKKIDHFGNIFAPGWFNCDVNCYNKIKEYGGNQDHVSNFVYTANQYFKNDSTSVLGQMLIQKGFTKAQNEESPNFKKKEPQKLNFIQGIDLGSKNPSLFTPTTDTLNNLISGQKTSEQSEKDDKE